MYVVLILVKLASPAYPQMCRPATNRSETLYSCVISCTLEEYRRSCSVSFSVELRARNSGLVSRKEMERGKVG